MEITKANFFYSFFNSEIYHEVKSNVNYFRLYNYESLANSKMNNVILNVIRDNIITDVTESYLRTVFKTEGFTDKEIDFAIDQIIDFKIGESSDQKTINEIITYVRQAVHKIYTDKVLREYGKDPIEVTRQMKAFNYIGAIKSKVPFERFSEMNIDQVADKSLKMLFKSGIKVIDDCTALGGVVSGKLYQVVGRPGGGKSLLMMHLAVQSAKSKVKTAYIVLGDLDRGDIITRIYGLATDTPLMEATLNQDTAYKYVSSGDLDKYLFISVLPANEVTIDEIVEAVREINAQLVVIDYDANTKMMTGSMYEEGNTTYSAASQLTVGDGRTVIMGSQPKPQYWNNDYLDLLCANESSRKQQHVAIMVTIGVHHNPQGNPCGYLTIAKNRIGKEIQSTYLRSSSGRFIEVDKATYGAYADVAVPRLLDSDEIIEAMKANQVNEKPVDIAGLASINDFASNIPDATK